MVHVGSGMVKDDSSAASPPAPALPPRRYRGETDLTMVDRLPPVHPSAALSSRCMDATNGESTLPHDTYANQLRRQARRYQQSRGSSFSHPRPPPPDWKPPPPPFSPQELPPQPSSDDIASRSFESEHRKSNADDALGSAHISELEAHRSFITSSSTSSYYSTDKSSAHTSMPELETPNADTGLSASRNKTLNVQQTNLNLSQSPGNSSFDSNSTSDQHLESSSSMSHGHPAVDVVSGYDRYYSVGDHTASSLSRSTSSFIPSDSQSSEASYIRRSSQSAVQLRLQATRRGSHSTESSPQSAESSAIERSTSSASLPVNSDSVLIVDQKVGLTSDAGLPAGKRQLYSDVEVRLETAPSFEDTEASSSNVEESLPEVTEPSLTELKFFRRQKFPAEVDCVQQAEVVAGLLRRMDRDEALVNVLVPAAGHRTATDFMAKVLGIVESEHRSYDHLPESLRLRLSARDARHAAL